jgi:hypothetical protein
LTKASPGPFVYFTASCLDLVLYGLDKFLKSNPAYSVESLANGTYNSLFKVPSSFSFPDVGTPAGKILLNSVGDREGDYNIMNVDAMGEVKLAGRWSNQQFQLFQQMNYPGNTAKRPKDAIDPNDVADFAILSDAGGVIGILCSLIGVLLAFGTMTFFIIHRGAKAITSMGLKISLVQIMTLGFAYLQFLLMIEKPSNITCTLDSVLLPVLFSFYYGVLFAKGYRIYSIFNAVGQSSRFVDWKVILLGVILAFPTIITVLVWIGLEPPSPLIVQSSPLTYYWTCSSSSSMQSITFGILIAWNTVVLLMNLILVFKSTNIPTRFYNGKSTTLSVYNTAMVLLFLLVILSSDSMGFRVKLYVKLLGVFYILTFNLVAEFTSKLFLNQLSATRASSRTSETSSIQTAKKDQKKFMESKLVLRVKRLNGLNKFFGETVTCAMDFPTADILLLNPVHKASVNSDEFIEDSLGSYFSIQSIKKMDFFKGDCFCNVNLDQYSAKWMFDTKEATEKCVVVLQRWKARIEMNGNKLISSAVQ